MTEEQPKTSIGYDHLMLNSDFEISRADVEKFVEMLKKKISESDAETCGCLPIDSLPPSNKE